MSNDARLTAEQVEELRRIHSLNLAIHSESFNALCDMALRSLAQSAIGASEPVAIVRRGGSLEWIAAETSRPPGTLLYDAAPQTVPMEERRTAALAWAVETFGDVALDPQERACRFIEEAIELVHSTGMQAEMVESILIRCYRRPAGEMTKEFSQAMLTLELLAEVMGTPPLADLSAAEFERIKAVPLDEWTRRHEAKVALGIASNTPSMNSLRQAVAQTFKSCDANGDWHEQRDQSSETKKTECSECPTGDCSDCPRKPAHHQWGPV